MLDYPMVLVRMRSTFKRILLEYLSGNSSVGRARPAAKVGGREFESRFPLQISAR